MVAIEKTLLDEGIHTSWLTVKDTSKTHQVATAILPTTSGEILKIRQGVNAKPEHLEIYKSLTLSGGKILGIWREKSVLWELCDKLSH